MHEECGVFAVIGAHDVVDVCHQGLLKLQHRGQDAFGIATFDGEHVRHERHLGQVFLDQEFQLQGQSAIGHVRYATSGGHDLAQAQPLLMQTRFGPVALAHNGHIANARELAKRFELPVQTLSDTEVVLCLIDQAPGDDFLGALRHLLGLIRGAYSMVGMTSEGVFAVRDPHGVRPLCIAPWGDAWVISSETSALPLRARPHVFDVAPGELAWVSHDGEFESMPDFATSGAPLAQCVFELIYFARPDSVMFGHDVQKARRALGRQLARCTPLPPKWDLVCGVPESGLESAQGYADFLGCSLSEVIIREPKVGRSFTESTPQRRAKVLAQKFRVRGELVEGKHVVVVDDSLVRGTTTAHLSRMLHQAGAKSVHWRIASAPIVAPCFYGIDIPTSGPLVASVRDPKALASALGVGSVAYLSVDEMLGAVGRQFCTACFTGEYKVERS